MPEANQGKCRNSFFMRTSLRLLHFVEYQTQEYQRAWENDIEGFQSMRLTKLGKGTVVFVPGLMGSELKLTGTAPCPLCCPNFFFATVFEILWCYRWFNFEKSCTTTAEVVVRHIKSWRLSHFLLKAKVWSRKLNKPFKIFRIGP